MRLSVVLLALVLAVSFGLPRVPSAPASDLLPSTPAPDGAVAVVELFTSEGCSSCPPADALLGVLAKEVTAADAPVLLLSWHVDYWDRLGWPDPFASPEASERQRTYAAAVGSQRVYTPQMVVGGTEEFVGHDSRSARAAIGRALATPLEALDEVTVSRDGQKTIVRWAPITGEVTVAVTQPSARVEVPRGENAGRTLDHVHVVRASGRVAGKVGALSLVLPRDIDGGRVIVLRQDAKGAVLGARALALPEG